MIFFPEMKSIFLSHITGMVVELISSASVADGQSFGWNSRCIEMEVFNFSAMRIK